MAHPEEHAILHLAPENASSFEEKQERRGALLQNAGKVGVEACWTIVAVGRLWPKARHWLPKQGRVGVPFRDPEPEVNPTST